MEKNKTIVNDEKFQDYPGEDIYIDEKNEDPVFLQKQDVIIINNNPRNEEGPKLK